MEHVLETIVRTLWRAMFPALELETLATVPERLGEEELVAFVGFAGGWAGRLLVRCSDPLARRLAVELYQRPSEEVSAEDTGDLLCELANVVGGNLVTALTDRPRISLPTLVRGREFRFASRDPRTRHALALAVAGDVLVVELRGE